MTLRSTAGGEDDARRRGLLAGHSPSTDWTIRRACVRAPVSAGNQCMSVRVHARSRHRRPAGSPKDVVI